MKPLPPSELAAAAANPSHPQHHFAWGQILGVALFGLAGFEGGPAVWANPSFLQQFIGGVLSLFPSASTPAQAPVPTLTSQLPTGTQLA